jgi:antitoxin (DNA-binding transcriptional repressor) of toxin-antitoxin stability system
MLEVDITNTSITINQLLNQVEIGKEVLLIRHGKAIARLSAISSTPQPLMSHKELRAAQSQTAISTLQTLQSLRQEARY